MMIAAYSIGLQIALCENNISIVIENIFPDHFTTYYIVIIILCTPTRVHNNIPLWLSVYIQVLYTYIG